LFEEHFLRQATTFHETPDWSFKEFVGGIERIITKEGMGKRFGHDVCSDYGIVKKNFTGTMVTYPNVGIDGETI
jgi:hypothetical protein